MAPEVLMGSVCTNFWAVHKNTPRLEELAKDDKVPWSKTHSWFANQGGFHVYFPSDLPDPTDDDAFAETDDDPSTEIVDDASVDIVDGPHIESTAMSPTEESLNFQHSTDRVPATDSRSTVDEAAIEPAGTSVIEESPEPQHSADRAAATNSPSRVAESAIEPVAINYTEEQPEPQHSTNGAADIGSAIESTHTNSTEEFVLNLEADSETPRLNARREIYFRRRAKAVRRYGPLPGMLCEAFRIYIIGCADELEEHEMPWRTDACLHHLNHIWAVDSWQLLSLRDKGIIKLPKVTAEELEDRNKSNDVVKLLAIIQICWMGTQLVARAIRGLPCTNLEITTVAFTASSLVTYLLQWSSIKDPTVPIRLKATKMPTADQFDDIIDGFGQGYVNRVMPTGPGFGNDSYHCWSSSVPPSVYTASFVGIGGILFGGIHFVAWDFAFPTPLEQTLWRASAVVTIAAPVIDGTGMVVLEKLRARLRGSILRDMAEEKRMLTDGVLIKGYSALIFLTIPIYVAARIFLLVESLRSLYFLPPTAYQATWTKNAPHFA